MRVEREAEKGYRIIIDTKTDVREMRGVTGISLDGEAVNFSCMDGSVEKMNLGSAGFRKLRRKMWRADVLKQWGVGKLFFAGLVAFLAIYFAILVAVEYATSDGSCGSEIYSEDGYTVTQPFVPGAEPSSPPAEGWRP